MIQLFLDSDGVLTDFDKKIQELYGCSFKELEEQYGIGECWKRVSKCKDFYYHLDLMPDALELWNAVKHTNPIIITGVPHGGWADEQKHRGLRKHFGQTINVITCMARNKSLFMKPGDVIVDDFTKYKDPWEEKGGIFVVHTSAKNSIEQLQKLGII